MGIVVLVAVLPSRRASAQCPDGSPPAHCARRGAPLDPERYLILPFAHDEGSQSGTFDGGLCARFLTEALGRWDEVRLADKTRIDDALARQSARAPFHIPFDSGLAIARQLGAGKLVMGSLWGFADTLHLRADLYDTSRGTLLRSATTRVPATGDHVGAGFNTLADLLLGTDDHTARGPGAQQTRSLRALRAYNRGERAMREWDLAGAARQFRDAVAADPEFALAYVELGQALLWAADSTPEAARDRTLIAHRAATLLGKLGYAERPILVAQLAMFEERWTDACRQYREILAADSTNFAGWYGLAECNARDRTVIRYARDTSRFTFRGSYETAVQAYRRALLLVPAFNLTFERRAIDRLPRLLFAERWLKRVGEHGREAYYAFPELDADTLAFYAVPGAVAARGKSEPATHLAAVARNRKILNEVTRSFVDAFPDEPLAHRALARSLEVTGQLVPELGVPRSALGEFASAQRRDRDPRRRTRDAADRVRVLLKAGQFVAARRLGDSLLQVAGRRAAGIAGVAILLGRPVRAAQLLIADDTTSLATSADNQPVAVPPGAAQTGLALLAYAAVAAPTDSVKAYEQRVEDFAAGLPAAQRGVTRSALLDQPAELVFDVMGLRSVHRRGPPGPDVRMLLQWAIAHGDTVLVRAALDSLARLSGGKLTSGESHPDAAYVAATLALAVKDSGLAARALDAPLDSLEALSTQTLEYLPLAGCLVRMMALRARLAAARGEADTTRRWANALVTLWSGAEPALQPTVAEMRRLAATAR